MVDTLLLAIEAGSSERVTLVPDKPYSINVTVSPTTLQQYSLIIVQVHTQKNLLSLASSDNVTVINGSHVGLIHLFSNGVTKGGLEYYITCYHHGNNRGNVSVMIVAQLLANSGMC